MHKELYTVQIILGSKIIDSNILFHSMDKATAYSNDKRLYYLGNFEKDKSNRIFDLLSTNYIQNYHVQLERQVIDGYDENGTTYKTEQYIDNRTYKYRRVKTKLDNQILAKCLQIFDEMFIFDSNIIKLEIE